MTIPYNGGNLSSATTTTGVLSGSNAIWFNGLSPINATAQAGGKSLSLCEAYFTDVSGIWSATLSMNYTDDLGPPDPVFKFLYQFASRT